MSISTRTIEDIPVISGEEAALAAQDEAESGRAGIDRGTAGLIALLVAAVAADRLGLRIGVFNVRSEFIVGGLVALAALIKHGTGTLKTFGAVEACLAGWLAVNVLSSLLFSPDTGESLKDVAVVTGLLTIYAAARQLIRPGASLKWASVMLVLAGSVVALVGLVSALLYNVLGPNPGLLLEKFYRDGVFVVTPKVQSVMWEPNIFGSFSLAVCALGVALTLARLRSGYDERTIIGRLPLWGLYLSSALGMCGVMLSMTRTVWVVGPPLVLAMAVAAWKLRLADARTAALSLLVPSLVGGAIGLGVGMSLPAYRWEMGSPWELTQTQIDNMVRERLFGAVEIAVPVTVQPTIAGNTTVPTATPMPVENGSAAGDRIEEVLEGPGDTPSLSVRWRVFSDAFEGWLQKPLLGWGAGAFPLVYPPPPEGGYWIANVALHTLFDTGIAGLALLSTAAFIVGRRALKAISYPPARWDEEAFVTFGLLSTGIGLLVAFQVTDGSWLGFTWVLMGMLAAGGERQAKNGRQLSMSGAGSGKKASAVDWRHRG